MSVVGSRNFLHRNGQVHCSLFVFAPFHHQTPNIQNKNPETNVVGIAYFSPPQWTGALLFICFYAISSSTQLAHCVPNVGSCTVLMHAWAACLCSATHAAALKQQNAQLSTANTYMFLAAMRTSDCHPMCSPLSSMSSARQASRCVLSNNAT